MGYCELVGAIKSYIALMKVESNLITFCNN